MATQFAARWCANAALGLLGTGAMLGRELSADDVEPTTWALAELGKTFSAVDLARAMAVPARSPRAIGGGFADGGDLLLTPPRSQPPMRLAEIGGAAASAFDGVAKA